MMARVWLLRLALLAIVLTIPLRLTVAADSASLDDRARQVFEQAGYHVAVVRPEGAAGHRSVLVAKSPECAGDVMISGVTIAGMMDDDPAAQPRTAPVYAFGDWSGSHISRPRLVFEVIKLRLRNAIGLGRTVWASPVVLKFDDPSACLIVAPPDLARIWRDSLDDKAA